MRVLAVDLGGTRTGLALSDALGVTCRPLDVIVERDPEARIAKVVAAAEAEKVEVIVVGLPRPLSGGTNQQSEVVVRFVGELRAVTAIPVETWDERFTSRLAERHRPRGSSSDDVAACYLLQSYLDHRARRKA